MNRTNQLNTLLREEYQKRLEVNLLRQLVYTLTDPADAPQDLLDQLKQVEGELGELEQKVAEQAKAANQNGVIVDTNQPIALMGAKSTGLEVQVNLRMAQVPTSICHLFNAQVDPLVSCQVRNTRDDGKIRRLRVTSFVDGYSARAVDTIELDPLGRHTFDQLPTFFLERIRNVNELTRAALNVLVEDMNGNVVELHVTKSIWLLARTTVPLAVKDPQDGTWRDMTRYFGAYVTPNAPKVQEFLSNVRQHHPQGRLVGYQVDEAEVDSQAKAIFDALKSEGKIGYVNSVVAFSPEDGALNQRVRLPQESLGNGAANCIDGTVLFASLLEAISMSPAIVTVPGHALVAWETWKNSGQWKYLETTMISTNTFEEACASGEKTTANRKAQRVASKNEKFFRQWELRELRANYGITPLE